MNTMIRRTGWNVVHVAQYGNLSLCSEYAADFEPFEGTLGSRLANEPHLCMACDMVQRAVKA